MNIVLHMLIYACNSKYNFQAQFIDVYILSLSCKIMLTLILLGFIDDKSTLMPSVGECQARLIYT